MKKLSDYDQIKQDNELAVIIWNQFGYLKGRGIDAHLMRYSQIVQFLRERQQATQGIITQEMVRHMGSECVNNMMKHHVLPEGEYTMELRAAVEEAILFTLLACGKKAKP